MPFIQACDEFIRLTNIAFGAQSSVKPVFLLDGIQGIARIKSNVPLSKSTNGRHTILSLLLQDLVEYHAPCIVAGTYDGQLKLVCEYSQIQPTYVSLECFEMEAVQAYGQALVRGVFSIEFL